MGQRRITDVASAVHHTDTTGGTWDGPAAVASMPNDKTVLTYCHAWHESGAGDIKGQYKFPHHKTDGGAAFTAGCSAGLGRLNQADIPESDKAGVRAHLQAHLDDAAGDSADDHTHPHPHVRGSNASVGQLMARMSPSLPEVVRRARAMAAEAGELPPPRETPFWTIRNAAGPDTTEMMIYGDIGFDWFGDGITAGDFAKDLAMIRTPKLTLRVNSGGGDVFDGIAIANLLRAWDGTVTGIVDGLCASIATVILMACNEIEMGRNTQAMIHDASGFCFGNPADMTEMADLLTMISDNIAGVYADRAGGSVRSWRERMTAETWYTADAFVAAGLADRVTPLANEDAAMVPCPDCGGTGKVGKKTCAGCGGTGQVQAEDAEDAAKTKCSTCDGSGTIRRGKVTCPDCNGTGTTGDDAAEDATDAELASMIREAYASAVAYYEPRVFPESIPTAPVAESEPAPLAIGPLADLIKESVSTVPVDVGDLRTALDAASTNAPEPAAPPAPVADLGAAPERRPAPDRGVPAAVTAGVRSLAEHQPEPAPAAPAPIDLGPAPLRPTNTPSEPRPLGLADLIGGAIVVAATGQPEPELAHPEPEAPPEAITPYRLNVVDVRRAVREARL